MIEQSEEPPVAERGVAPSGEVGDEFAQLLRQVAGRGDAGLLDPAAYEGAVRRGGAHQRPLHVQSNENPLCSSHDTTPFQVRVVDSPQHHCPAEYPNYLNVQVRRLPIE
ncbi:hypothetical protein ACFVAQ_36680 [Streptomyces sp. NPDC057651]|uniref:hypothetical protein n=1 Tax=unclassified Streptomyces TaxID=2593676 RepID=UPI0036D04671